MDLHRFIDENKEKVKENLVKQLKKIRAGLEIESAQTKEMLNTYQRFSMGQASEEELKKANGQFRSFVKTMGLGVLAILPFSPITIPAIVKLGEKYGVDVLPDSFKQKPQTKNS